jgi:hypothetical protein
MPSIASARAPESTTIGAKSGFSAISSTVSLPAEALDRHLVIEPATTIWPLRASLLRCTASRSPSRMPALIIDRPRTRTRKVGTRLEQAGIERITALDIFHRQYRAAGSHAADQRQAELLDQADAARRTGFEHDDAFLGKRLEVLLSGIVRGEAEGTGDFGPRRRRAEDFPVCYE